MKFEQAFDKIFEIEKERMKKEGIPNYSVSPKTAKAIAFLWSMLAVTGTKIDDIAYIDANNNIVSMPIPETKESKPAEFDAEAQKSKRGRPSSIDKTASRVEDDAGDKQ